MDAKVQIPGCVNTECLTNGWITSGRAKVIRMAFNLYCNGAPSLDDYKDHDEQLSECIPWKISFVQGMQDIFGKQSEFDIQNTAFR